MTHRFFRGLFNGIFAMAIVVGLVLLVLSLSGCGNGLPSVGSVCDRAKEVCEIANTLCAIVGDRASAEAPIEGVPPEMKRSIDSLLALLREKTNELEDALTASIPSVQGKPFATALFPGDTIFYTLDGTDPDRNSPYVTQWSNGIWVDTTTVVKGRLKRAGFALSSIGVDTIHVASGFYQTKIAVVVKKE